jgi:hypothetical protein
MMTFDHRFSLPHPDRWRDPKVFPERLVNADSEYRKEICDIYFGRTFYYTYAGEPRTYGEVMGAEASDAAYRSLLDIQEHMGIPISLTINAMNQPRELVEDKALLREFTNFIGGFYSDGVRHCTISHVHLMNLGVLQDRFPAMHWKNTVNHRVCSAQEFIDYAVLGYRTIILDRSLNRNLAELARVKEVAEQRGCFTSVLAQEGCIPACPFKHEHDSWQRDFEKDGGPSYWHGVGHGTCGYLRKERAAISPGERHALPRATTDIIWVDRDDFAAYAKVVDVFKFWGRLSSEPPTEHRHQVSCWRFAPGGTNKVPWRERPIWAASFREIYEANLLPFNRWVFNSYMHGTRGDRNWDLMEEANTGCAWLTDRGRVLAKQLQNCRTQCYRCHACERLFDIEEFDSILGWRRIRR